MAGGFTDFLLGSKAQEYDPYAQSRGAVTGMLQQGQQDMANMQAQPYLDPEMMRYLDNEAEELTRSSMPYAGKSGYQEDAVWRKKLDVRMAALDRAMKERQSQRQYLGQLAGATAGMPTQIGQRTPGALENAGREMTSEFTKGMAGQMGNAAAGGMSALGDAAMNVWKSTQRAPMNPNTQAFTYPSGFDQ